MGLLYNKETNVVEGVKIKRKKEREEGVKGPSSVREELKADFVVCAAGRKNQVRKWLQQMEVISDSEPLPQVSCFPGLGYCTSRFRAPAGTHFYLFLFFSFSFLSFSLSLSLLFLFLFPFFFSVLFISFFFFFFSFPFSFSFSFLKSTSRMARKALSRSIKSTPRCWDASLSGRISIRHWRFPYREQRLWPPYNRLWQEISPDHHQRNHRASSTQHGQGPHGDD